MCPELNIGAAADIQHTLVTGGPYFQTGGAGCGFWLALVDDNVVAYKAKQPSGCTLKLKRDHWECDGQPIDATSLSQYPVAIQTVNNIDAVIVDLRPTPASTAPTRATTSSLPRP